MSGLFCLHVQTEKAKATTKILILTAVLKYSESTLTREEDQCRNETNSE